jgi:basic membrane protein A and related proteins
MTGRTAGVAAAAAAALALAVAGCGGGENSGTPSDALKVGLITDAGQLNDKGFNELAYKGLKKSIRELGVEGRVVESKSSADYVPNMAALVRQGYGLIFGVGFAQGDAIATAAKRFPDVKFAIVDYDHANLKGSPPNAEGLLFEEEQVGYLVGTLAALTAKREGATTISAVGGYKEPPVDRFIAGYRAGAQAAVPGTKVIFGYSQDWDDQAKCKELALGQIAKGSKVVFQVAGECGLGALSAANDKKVWGIGVDADQSFLGTHILTSALKGVDQAVFLTVESVQDGTWEGGGNAIFGLDQDGVGLGTVSDEVPQEDLDEVETVEQKIADGEITGIPTTLG